ncbi:conserved oligomeric Golgi complex subunit 8, partial [Biomphalaria glabrata]
LSHWIGLTFFNDAWIWMSDNSPVSLDTYLLDNFQTNIEHWPACGCVSIHNDIYGFYMMERECSNTLNFLCMRPAIKIFTTNVESSTNTTHFSVTSKRPNNEKQVAEDKGKLGDEDKGKQAAEDKGKQGDEDKGKQAAEEKGKQAAEDKGKQVAEDKGKQGADDKGKQD